MNSKNDNTKIHTPRKTSRLNLIGQKIGLLTVVKNAPDYITPNGRVHTAWYCDCECGTKNFYTTTERLRNGKYKSCGCLNKKNQFKKKLNTYDLTGDYGIGYTSKGEKFYFDLEDYNKIKNYCWYLQDDYVATNSSGNEYFLMHRLILNAPSDLDVDHINHKKSDNRKVNLRLTTTQQNCSNRVIKNDYGINGIHFLNGRWYSSIGYKNKRISLGGFANLKEAIKARKQAEEKYYGEYSYSNSMKISERNVI